jgi:hypothetical protein
MKEEDRKDKFHIRVNWKYVIPVAVVVVLLIWLTLVFEEVEYRKGLPDKTETTSTTTEEEDIYATCDIHYVILGDYNYKVPDTATTVSSGAVTDEEGNELSLTTDYTSSDDNFYVRSYCYSLKVNTSLDDMASMLFDGYDIKDETISRKINCKSITYDSEYTSSKGMTFKEVLFKESNTFYYIKVGSYLSNNESLYDLIFNSIVRLDAEAWEYYDVDRENAKAAKNAYDGDSMEDAIKSQKEEKTPTIGRDMFGGY